MIQQNFDSPDVLDALAKGDLGRARELSGSVFVISATVVHGNHLGRTLGFPTANLDLSDNHPFLLAHGVYAVTAVVNSVVYKGMANAGIRPTISGKALSVEVNLFDFSGDLYGTTLVVSFLERIRDEVKFETLDLLVQQIHHDKQTALKLLA
jgi:riboflavin kinase/FMN adenylyltransferase